MEPPLLRVQEAAALLRVSKWTVYRWIEEGRLRASKIGRGSLRIFRASVNGLIDGQRTDQAIHESNGRSQVVSVRSSLRASKRRG